MQSWVPVQARVISGGVDENTDSEGSTTYKAHAEYKYSYNGQDYTATRVAIDTTADNIGHAHEERGQALAAAANEGRSIEVYVDPEMPYSAVIYRDRPLGHGRVQGVVCGAVRRRGARHDDRGSL